MERNQLRICLIALMMAGLILLSLSAASNRSASAGQGKGGEVIAKPTPTPKKTTTKRNTPARTTNNSTTNRPAKSGAATAAEMIFWNTIKDSTNPDDFKEYLKKYPNGEFAGLAANRLKTLEAAKSSTSPSSTNPNPTNPTSTSQGTTNPNTPNSSSLNLPRTRTNQTGIEFVLIPAGSFMMGSTNGGIDEQPVHQVTISQPFYMGRYEVTQAQWQSVMGNNPSYFKDCGGNCPVEQVSWNDAQNFISKLNENNDGFTYRLPTEAEWEYACRAGTTGDYAGELDSMAWYLANSGTKTHAVGGKQPNGFGLYDMHGNVWEWCRDWWDANYYGSSPATDPKGPGSGRDRVLRGGSSSFIARGARSAYRYVTPVNRDDFFGFRVVAVARTNPGSTNSSLSNVPLNPPSPLHSFTYPTLTMDNSGTVKSRETKTAQAFTENLVGGVKLEMVAIPPGEFVMGSAENEAGRKPNEAPLHRVKINYWLYVGKFEVTWAQWRAVLQLPRVGPIPMDVASLRKDDDFPVRNVSWDNVKEFCARLSKATGREYRLLTEAEWEYAARAGTTTPFAFGETVTPEIVNYSPQSPYGRVPPGGYRVPLTGIIAVGSLGVANQFGLYDMHGNVAEWCEDIWSDSYNGAPSDGSAMTGSNVYRVARGGTEGAAAAESRSANRIKATSTTGANWDGMIGFRVVVVARTQ